VEGVRPVSLHPSMNDKSTIAASENAEAIPALIVKKLVVKVLFIVRFRIVLGHECSLKAPELTRPLSPVGPVGPPCPQKSLAPLERAKHD
jgi:hypothetical protein